MSILIDKKYDALSSISVADPSSNEPKRALRVAEVCRICGFSRAWLYSAWAAGTGPARFKLGTMTLISVEALDSWLKSLESGFSQSGVGGAA